MKDVKKIKGSNCGLLSNAAHLNFHQRILERMRLLAKPDVYRVTDELEEYNGNIDDEKERTFEGTGTGKTVELNEINQRRRPMIIYISQLIAASEKSPVTEVKTAGRMLKPVYAPYKGIQREADDKKTALIDSLLHDLRKDEYTEYINALNLSAALDELEAVNNEYKQTKEERTNEALSRKLDSSKVLRQRTDATYMRLCELIYANMLLLPEEGSMVALNKLVDEINAIIDEVNASYNLSKALKNANKKDEIKPENPNGGEGEGGNFEPIPVP